MNKLARYGIFFIVLMVCLAVLAVSSQPVQATAGSTDADKEAAIEAANHAISRVPKHFRHVDPVIESSIEEARDLVDTAMKDYGATRSDFPDLNRLEAAEKQLEKMDAIQAARDAIDKIPPPLQITEEHRNIIEEARRLTAIAMEQYGATYFDLCWRYKVLEDAEDRLDDVDDPDPEPDPLPPTGAMSTTIVSGLLLTGTGLLLWGKRKNRF